MTSTLGTRRITLRFVAFVVALAIPALALTPPATTVAGAATPITVGQAIGTQNGSTATVRGYVVGQPTATNTVVTSGYPNDYALALADSASETSTARMLYVQIPDQYRSSFGLRSNPSLRGKQIDVTGQLTAYFTHAGLKNGSAFTLVGSNPPPEPPPATRVTTTPTPRARPAPSYGQRCTASSTTRPSSATTRSGTR